MSIFETRRIETRTAAALAALDRGDTAEVRRMLSDVQESCARLRAAAKPAPLLDWPELARIEVPDVKD